MKKIIILAAIGIMSFSTVFSQNCASNVWMTLKSGQIGKARKAMDECLIANPNSAEVWLMNANVYLQRYQQEEDLLAKNKAYIKKDPDAIWVANESFYKAKQLDQHIQPKVGMIGPDQGQILCAEPLYYAGLDFAKKKEYDKAIEYINTAIRNFKLDTKNPNLAMNLGLIYFNLAKVATAKNDPELYKKTLLEGVAVKTPVPEIYLSLYDLYKAEKDTANCEKILKTAHLYVPANNANDVYGAELDYYAMTGNVEMMNSTCDTIIARMGEKPEVFAMVANYLNNGNQYEKAEGYILRGLAIDSTNFDLVQQMGYKYFFEALNYQTLIQELISKKQYMKANDLLPKEKESLENSHTWVEKAYNLNGNDYQNNLMFRQLKVRLQLEVPEELNAKIEAVQNAQ